MSNLVAHDFLALKRTFDLKFEFNPANWLTYCSEDIYRPGRRWSDARVEAEQKELLRAFVESLDPTIRAAVQARIAARAAAKPPRPLLRRRSLRGLLSHTWQRLTPSRSASIQDALERRAR